MFEQLRQALPGAIFHPPATSQQIDRVEEALNTRLPAWLRELYLHTNGIKSVQHHDPYLFSLEDNDDFPRSLLSWNRFLRNQWKQSESERKADFPEVDWDKLDVHRLLIIGGVNGRYWAIDPAGGPEIINHEASDVEDRTILASDLVSMCVDNEEMDQQIRSELFRGRKPIRRYEDAMPPSSDIELLLDTLVDLYRGTKGTSVRLRNLSSPGWSLYQGISQRPGEEGMLFILQRGSFEIQVATRDGNLFFVLRSKVWFQEEPLRCLVKDLPETLLCILYLFDMESFRTGDPSLRKDIATQTFRVWRHRYGPLEEKLEQMAEVLFHRDDYRMQEENRMGE